MSATMTEEAKPILGFETRVKAIRQLSPHLKRFTLEGESLRNFGADEHGRTLDLRIKIMIPNPGADLPDLPQMIAETEGSWYQRWLSLDPDTRGNMRTYTVRERRADAGEVDIDFVLHIGEDGHSGPACEWAMHARVGDPMTLIGPNAERGTCQGIEFQPGEAKQLLLVGDETAVPAISAILEHLDESYRARVILEVPGAEDFQDLHRPAGVEVTWLARNGAEHGSMLTEAVRGAYPASPSNAVDPEDVNVDEVILWETGFERDYQRDPANFYAWIAGEAGAVKTMRRYLVRDVGVDRKNIAFMGYWRRGKAES